MKTRPVGAELFLVDRWPDRRTDRQEEELKILFLVLKPLDAVKRRTRQHI